MQIILEKHDSEIGEILAFENTIRTFVILVLVVFQKYFYKTYIFTKKQTIEIRVKRFKKYVNCKFINELLWEKFPPP